MRTRLLKPEYWADSRMADLSDGTRLTYMGLWCLADDDGYFVWAVRDIAAELFRFQSVRKREPRIERDLDSLLVSDRIKRLACTVHGLIPSIPKYRIKGGNQSTHIHRVHTDTCLVRTGTDKSLSYTSSLSVSDSLTGSVAAPKAAGSKTRSLADENPDLAKWARTN